MTSTKTYRDLTRRYESGLFRTLCSCGYAATGITADGADFAFFDHLDAVSAATGASQDSQKAATEKRCVRPVLSALNGH